LFKKLLKYGGIFLVSYLLITLLFNSRSVKTGHASFFQGTTQSIIKTLVPEAFIRFDAADSKNPYTIRVVYNSQLNVDNQIAEARRKRTPNINLQVYDFNFDIFVLYILPLGFLIALLIASPVPWKRKLMASILGYLALIIFCVVRLWILVLHQISRESLEIYNYSTATVNTLGTLSSFFTPGLVIVVTVFIWIGVTFRKEDFKKLKDLIEV
jgi:hypothetical protein